MLNALIYFLEFRVKWRVPYCRKQRRIVLWNLTHNSEVHNASNSKLKSKPNWQQVNISHSSLNSFNFSENCILFHDLKSKWCLHLNRARVLAASQLVTVETSQVYLQKVSDLQGMLGICFTTLRNSGRLSRPHLIRENLGYISCSK